MMKQHDWSVSDACDSHTCRECGADAITQFAKGVIDRAPCVADEPTIDGLTFPEIFDIAMEQGCNELFSRFEVQGKTLMVCGSVGHGGQPETHEPIAFSCGDQWLGRHQYSDWMHAMRMREVAAKIDERIAQEG